MTRITPGSDLPSFQELMADRQALWVQHKWAPGVLVSEQLGSSCGGDPAPGGAPGRRRKHTPTLHEALMQLTARSCALCDPGGREPFATDKQLRLHLRTGHGRALCEVCVQTGRR